jgi:hypothetical protein
MRREASRVSFLMWEMRTPRSALDLAVESERAPAKNTRRLR